MLMALLVAGFMTLTKPVYTMENTYPRAMEIVEIDRMADIAVCVDAVGFEWEFTEPEDLEVGDLVICTMYTKGTQTILDDEIVDVIWSGYYFESGDFKRIGDKEIGK